MSISEITGAVRHEGRVYLAGDEKALAEDVPDWVDLDALAARGALRLGRGEPSGLPEDFPHASYLERDGRFTSPESVNAASTEELESVSGISEARLADIRAYLS
jgi:hypothetical protein